MTGPDQSADQSSASRYALAFIFITMLVDTIGLGIIIPVTPAIIAQLTGHKLGDPHAMSEAAWWGGWLATAFSGMLFLFSPLMGNLSDRFGRRPVLIVSLLALGIDYLITGLAPTLWWLFIGRVLSGIAGAAFGIGFVIGPAIGGLLGQYGARLPFFVSAGLAVANALFGLFVLKESLPPERRRKFELWRANPVGSLAALRRYPAVLGFVAILALMRLAHDANPVIWTYYVYLKFHWTPLEVGYSMMFLGLIMALVFGFLTRILIPKLGEHRAAYIGLFCGAAGFTGYAFATEGWMMYAWMSVWAMMGLAMPSINGIISKHVPPNEQGELQGALASVGGVTSIMAPLLLTTVFAYFTSAKAPIYFPGAAFLTAGLMLLLAALLLMRVEHKSATSAQPAE